MKLTAAAKVGLVTLVSLGLMVISLSWLTQTSFRPKGYRMRAVFTDVAGLLPGTNVLLMGVKVGRVVSLQPQDRSVWVDLEILDRKTRILRGSHFKVVNKGLIGEKNLEIFPPPVTTVPEDANDYLPPDAVVLGDTPPRLEATMEQANKAIASLRDLADSPLTRAALKNGIRDFEATFRDLSALIRHADEVAVSAQTLVGSAGSLATAIPPEEVRAIVTDVRTLSTGLRRTYQELGLEGQQLADAKATLANLKDLTARLEGIAAEVEQIASDPQLKSDVKDLVTSSRDLVSSSKNVVSQLTSAAASPPQLSPRFDLMRVQSTTQGSLNGAFNMGLRMRQNAFSFGIEEIGEQNLWNMHWGKPDFFADGMGFHLGLVRSKIGFGLDWAPLSTLELTGEVFNPVTPSMRLAASYYPSWLGTRYGLTGAYIRQFTGLPDDRVYVGVQWRPLD